METRRTRIVNDPSDLVPLLQSFGSQRHRKLFELLASGWKSEEELEKTAGPEFKRSLEVLRRGGLLESKWRPPENGRTPDREYHSSYATIRANFQCSLEDVADLVQVMLLREEEVEQMAAKVLGEIKEGPKSLSTVCRDLGMNPTFIKGLAHRSSRFVIKGHRVEPLNHHD
ncbi:MAG: ArsR family transcriptional regulator [Halobacteria archaeon]